MTSTAFLGTLPALARQIAGVINATARHLTDDDRAALRGGTDPMPAWLLVARAGELAPPSSAALWRDIGVALGRVRPWGPEAGRLLATTGWAEPRMRALLAAEGHAASGLMAEALRWLVAHQVERVDLTALATVAVAAELGDREAQDWARHRLATAYVRAKID